MTSGASALHAALAQVLCSFHAVGMESADLTFWAIVPGPYAPYSSIQNAQDYNGLLMLRYLASRIQLRNNKKIQRIADTK